MRVLTNAVVLDLFLLIGSPEFRNVQYGQFDKKNLSTKYTDPLGIHGNAPIDWCLELLFTYWHLIFLTKFKSKFKTEN